MVRDTGMSSKGGLKCGVIGLGLIGSEHCKILQRFPEKGRLVAVCDRDEEKLCAYRKIPEVHLFTDYREMLDSEELECLVAATYADTHHQIVSRAVLSPSMRLIFCEKPLAVSVEQCQEMIDVCRKHSVQLAVNHGHRYSSPLQKIQQIVAAGDLGKPLHASWSAGGGRLGCIGSHKFDAMRWFLGSNPIWIVGFLDAKAPPNPRGSEFYDPGGFGMVGFENGARGFMDLGSDLRTPGQLVVVCEEARILVEVIQDRYEIWVRKPEKRTSDFYGFQVPLERMEIPFEKERNLAAGLIHEIEAACCGQRPICTGEDGKWAVEMVIAMHVSHRTGNGPIVLPLKDEEERAAQYAFT